MEFYIYNYILGFRIGSVTLVANYKVHLQFFSYILIATSFPIPSHLEMQVGYLFILKFKGSFKHYILFFFAFAVQFLKNSAETSTNTNLKRTLWKPFM